MKTIARCLFIFTPAIISGLIGAAIQGDVTGFLVFSLPVLWFAIELTEPKKDRGEW